MSRTLRLSGPSRANWRGATFIALLALVACAFFFPACNEKPGHNGEGGAGGGGGEGQGGEGGCPMLPEPEFLLTIEAETGPVPEDTRIAVSWSGGAVPVFDLADDKTWWSLEDSNLACNVEREDPPTDPLGELECEVWTSGATRVVVTADGFETFDETFPSKFSERCHGPAQLPIRVVLKVAKDEK